MDGEQVLMRPEAPLSESIARISFDGKLLRVYYPEKRELFRKTVKRIRFEWKPPYWTREVEDDAQQPHRAAELGRDLLAAGFCVKAPANIASMILAGEFDEEPRRTIGTSSDRYPGWFSLWWAKGEGCYEAAKKLPGARWTGVFVCVPPEQYEAVLDFAEIYGFRLNVSARAAVAAAREEREAAIVVSVEARRGTAVAPSGGIRRLAVPTAVEIDEDLRDDDD